jgi:hypothetical protein
VQLYVPINKTRHADQTAETNGNGGFDPDSCSPQFRENLEALAKLFKDDDQAESLILLADMKRELGEFALAMEMFDRVKIESLQPVVAQLRALCEKRIAAVHQLSFPKAWQDD